ncbi:amidohydrolase [Merdimmobilis hominis]|uniref:amidohydrolase n=1 Tax=Merdimmobilis hominis TaxID=2897707 RepID=UPI0008F91268|nr:amidohydrolase [Merdimmobilis hominis]
MTIQNVRHPDCSCADLFLEDGRIQQVGPAGSLAAGTESSIDGDGYLLLPPLCDCHAHLDKTTLGLDWIKNEVKPGLVNLIANEREHRIAWGLDPYRQAVRHIRSSLGYGVLAMRSHIDVDTQHGLSLLEGALAAREEYKDLFHLQLVAFPQSGLVSRPGTYELMDQALAMGADLVGGVDPSALDRDSKGCLDAIFALAQKHGKPVDIHLHEPAELGAYDMEEIIQRTEALGMQGKVAISHAFCLGAPIPGLVPPLLEKLARADITIITCGQPQLATFPHIQELAAAGVKTACGNDNIQDLWSHFGTPDMLQRASLIAMKNLCRNDSELDLVLDLCTRSGAQLLGLESWEPLPGGPADFLLVKGSCPAQCVAQPPVERMVFRRGCLIAKDCRLLDC